MKCEAIMHKYCVQKLEFYIKIPLEKAKYRLLSQEKSLECIYQ